MVNKVGKQTGADRMSGGSAACDKCTRQCVTVHQNVNRSPAVVNGFFKFMFGKNCSEILNLPPKFARTVQHLVGQKAKLEDSNGNKWPATFSNVGGCLSLQEGWAEFFREHYLEPGYVLVFNLMKVDHFIVHIYDKSACRIYDFTPRRPKKNKRCKSNPIIADKEDDCQMVEKNSTDKPNLNTQSVPASQISNNHNNVMGTIVPEDVGNSQIKSTSKNLAEDPICMLSRDTDYPVEDRNYLGNLSFFEVKKTTSDACDIKKPVEGTSAPRDDFITHQLHEEPSDYGNCSHELSYCKMKKPAADANDSGKFQEEAMTLNDDTEMIDGFFADPFREEPFDNFITSMQIDANLSPNDAEHVLSIKKELVESREKDKAPIQETLPTTAEHVLSIKKELVESSNKDEAPIHETLPITGSHYLSTMLINIPPAEQVLSIKKEVLESGEKDKAPTNVSLPPTSSPLVSQMLNFPPAAHVSSIKKELVESREKDKDPTHVSQPIINTQLLCSMLNIRPAKHGSSSTKDLVELRDKGQAPTCSSLPNISTHLLSSKFNMPGNLPTMEMKSGQTSSPAVKIEPGTLYDSNLPVATTSFSAQVKSLRYLELPVCIPLPVQQKRDMSQGRVVFLRDPSGKLWPVLYPDFYCVNAFTGNWRDFCEANHVKPGNVCKFLLESNDSSSCIYRVDVQKSGH